MVLLRDCRESMYGWVGIRAGFFGYSALFLVPAVFAVAQ